MVNKKNTIKCKPNVLFFTKTTNLVKKARAPMDNNISEKYTSIKSGYKNRDAKPIIANNMRA